MTISRKTQEKIGRRLPRGTRLDSAFGVTRATAVPGTDMLSDQERSLLKKADGQAIASNALTVEDTDIFSTEMYSTLYPAVVPPPYNLSYLQERCQSNNSLLQAVLAMVVNIDGTGFDFERADAKEKTPADEKKITAIRQLFDEPYPDTSFVTVRRQIRYDMETTGNGYLEVIRNSDGEITFMRRLDAKLVRLVKLDAPVEVEKTINRMGKEQTIKVSVRDRRYAQVVGKRVVFFREFGSARKLNRDTGFWEGDARSGTITAENEATEVIHFKVVEDVFTHYGVPRWINQVPSVLGSREAEEFNLEYFKHGGLPPVIMFVQGGGLKAADRDTMINYLSGAAKMKQRGMVVEVSASGGTLNDSNGVRVTTERFGGDRQSDGMFLAYDQRCAEHVRESFRLPELFVGNSASMTFATAYTSFLIAEAQVFKPERDEFDEFINVKIMNEINPEYWFRSKPVTIKDITQQLQGLQLVGGIVTKESLLDTVNELVGLDLTLDPNAGVDPLTAALSGSTPPYAPAPEGQPQPSGSGVPESLKAEPKKPLTKAEVDSAMVRIADLWVSYIQGTAEVPHETVAGLVRIIKSMTPGVRGIFDGYVRARMIPISRDKDGVSDAIRDAGEMIVTKSMRRSPRGPRKVRRVS